MTRENDIKGKNGKLILTARRRDRDRSETRKQTVEYPAFWSRQNKPSTGARKQKNYYILLSFVYDITENDW